MSTPKSKTYITRAQINTFYGAVNDFMINGAEGRELGRGPAFVSIPVRGADIYSLTPRGGGAATAATSVED